METKRVKEDTKIVENISRVYVHALFDQPRSLVDFVDLKFPVVSDKDMSYKLGVCRTCPCRKPREILNPQSPPRNVVGQTVRGHKREKYFLRFLCLLSLAWFPFYFGPVFFMVTNSNFP